MNTPVMAYLAGNLAEILKKVDLGARGEPEEIRLRSNRPLEIQNYRGGWFVSESGELNPSHEGAYIVKTVDIAKTLELMSQNSVYAYQEEIRNGYITIAGGHRVGIAGKVVLEGAAVKNIKEISGLSIRVAKQVHGCSEKIIRYVIAGPDRVYNTLIISPPRCGKTTILRDIARTLSNGVRHLNFKGVKVGIVDERSEIAACYKGVPQYDIGLRSDVLDGCPKALGMEMLIRSMSPDVIVTDEIGNEGDRQAIMSVLNAGVKIIASAHGFNISDLGSRGEVVRIIEDRAFERFIVLGNKEGPGTIVEVVDGTTMKTIVKG